MQNHGNVGAIFSDTWIELLNSCNIATITKFTRRYSRVCTECKTRKMEMGKQRVEIQKDESLLAFSNDKWRPQDCASDIQLVWPSPFVVHLFPTPFPPARFVQPLRRQVQDTPMRGFILWTGRKAAQASAFCWHLINKVQTIVPVGFTHRLLPRSSALSYFRTPLLVDLISY